MMMATALIGNVLDEIRLADAVYASVLLTCLDSSDKASHAKIRAETTSAYARRQEARDARVLLVEMIASLKYFLRVKTEEMRLAR